MNGSSRILAGLTARSVARTPGWWPTPGTSVFRESVDLNLTGHYVATRSAWESLRAGEGNRSVTFISSINALQGFGLVGYSATVHIPNAGVSPARNATSDPSRRAPGRSRFLRHRGVLPNGSLTAPRSGVLRLPRTGGDVSNRVAIATCSGLGSRPRTSGHLYPCTFYPARDLRAGTAYVSVCERALRTLYRVRQFVRASTTGHCSESSS